MKIPLRESSSVDKACPAFSLESVVYGNYGPGASGVYIRREERSSPRGRSEGRKFYLSPDRIYRNPRRRSQYTKPNPLLDAE